MSDLNDTMEFGHVITVDDHGQITDAWWIHAPEVCSDDIHPGGVIRGYVNPRGWSYLMGYSGQDRYAGPIMHPSEFIGGSMATDILATPGTYVAVVVDDIDGEADGWAVLRQDA